MSESMPDQPRQAAGRTHVQPENELTVQWPIHAPFHEALATPHGDASDQYFFFF